MRKLTLLCAAVIGLGCAQFASAYPFQLDSATTGNAKLNFTAVNSATTIATFTFAASTTANAGSMFIVNDNSGSWPFGDSNMGGVVGTLTGTFSILKPAVNLGGNMQQADVSGVGQVTFLDAGTGAKVTADLTWVDIETSGNGATLNLNSKLSLSNFAFSGPAVTNTDKNLQFLASTNKGRNFMTFQSGNLSFTTKSLDYLATHNLTVGSYSMTTIVPEPGFYMAMLGGMAGLFALRLRRKQQQ